jgi:tetratricopeptide (TPR) repeat protein
MKARLFMLTAALFAAIVLPTGFSAQSPSLRNPAGYGTVPPSSYRSGLVNSPNPIDTTGNLLVTGNVRRGMYFRGTVPYRSTTSFSGPLGSSALNSFLRDTAGPEDFGQRSDKYRVQPFYSPSQTVATIMPGRSDVFYPTGRIDSRVSGAASAGNGLLALDSPPTAQTSLGPQTAGDEPEPQDFRGRYRLLTEPPSTSEDRALLSPRQEDHLVPGQLGIRKEVKSSDRQEEKSRDASGTERDWEETIPGLDEPSGLAERQQAGELPARKGLVRRADEEGKGVETFKSNIEMAKPDGSVEVERPSSVPSAGTGLERATSSPKATRQGDSSTGPYGQDRREILDQIRKQLDALQKSVEAGLRQEASGVETPETDTLPQAGLSPSEDATALAKPLRSYQIPPVDSHLSPADEDQADALLESAKGAGQVGILNTMSSLDELRQRGVSGSSASAERTKEPSGNLMSFSQIRFNKHMGDAREHLKAGRYYRAADSFALAAVYQPDNPDVLAGRAHASFAAGEYMSSALFLARTLTIHPEYVREKVDLADMLGGTDKLAERITDVEQWLARSGSVQLEFLLSYVYFRTGRLDQARRAIAKAYEKMPDSPAVQVMKTAINQAVK